MADKPGGKPKGGDKKEAPPKPNGHDYLWWFAGIVFLLVGIGSIFSTAASPLVNYFDGATSGTSTQIIPEGTLATSSEVVTVRDTSVYDAPGKDILGTQKAGAKGEIIGGPIVLGGITYWDVNYENPPEGWVTAADISAHTAIASTVTAVPVFWSIIRELFEFIAFLLFLLVVYAIWKDSTITFPPHHDGHDKKPAGSDVYDKNIPEARKIIPGSPVSALPGAVQVNNEHWLSVIALLDSHNQNDWRQAIIEADIMLDEMLGKMGYDAPSVGEKLKMIEPSDFATLDDAWEAHKVRNRIAHQGKDYGLGQTAARQVIALYEKVFKEFYYI